MNKIYFVISVLVIAALACGSESSGGATTAPGSTSAPAATAASQSMGKVGDRIESNGVALTVNGITAVDNVDDIFKPDEGNVFVVVDVTFENVNKESSAYNLLYFKVKDSEGFEYNTSFAAPDPTFKSGELSAGDKVRGNVAFEVPEDAKGLELSYKAIDFSGNDAIKFELGDAPAP